MSIKGANIYYKINYDEDSVAVTKKDKEVKVVFLKNKIKVFLKNIKTEKTNEIYCGR
ncbi:MAG: hypothetical protein DDT19_00540 [Syntrophomonadaceae bacterium]|nr:hypothetical protein [Bacillota bacterium]